MNGDLYIGDVGQGDREEVSCNPAVVMAVKTMDGDAWKELLAQSFQGCTCNAPGLTIPIHDYDSTQSDCLVTGGYVYRGGAIPEIDGTDFWGFNQAVFPADSICSGLEDVDILNLGT